MNERNGVRKDLEKKELIVSCITQKSRTRIKVKEMEEDPIGFP